MIRLLVYHPERGFESDVPPERISELLGDPAATLWLDMEAPTAEELRILSEEFGFHPLAIEDVQHAHQRPKIEPYGDFYFLVLYAVSRARKPRRSLQCEEISVFLGTNFVATVHRVPMPVLADVEAEWKANPLRLKPGASSLLYELLDTVVDDYFPAVDTLGERIDDLEERVFAANDDEEALELLFGLKRDLLALRRIFSPERDVVNVLLRRELPFIEPQAIVYFQDIYDHLVRLTDSVDTFRELLSSALDAHLSVVSNRLNQVMRTMTAIATILMSLGLITGIYGMNFRFMPELQWRGGYFLVLALMLALGAGLVAYFRRIRWL